MSIRSKILAGCLTLTLLAGALGVTAQFAQRRLGQLGLDIYDNALMAISYLRAAQMEFVGHANRPGGLAGAGAMTPSDQDDLLSDLRVATDRAMSDRGRSAAHALTGLVLAATAGQRSAADAAKATAAFEHVVELYAGDGFRYRRRVALVMAQERRTDLLAMLAILAAALGLSALIGHLIATPVRHAVGIAQAIAAGKLDNAIKVRGHGETADLVRALATMQSAIAAAMDRIRGLMERQAASHADELLVRSTQMEAALGNMLQGLCLFGPDGRLLVINRQFGELFGLPPGAGPRAGDYAAAVMQHTGQAVLVDAVAAGGPKVLPCDLPDGRVIAMAQRTVQGGGWVTTFADITDRRRTETELAYVKRHDALTGLPNRLRLAEYLAAVPHATPDETVAVLCLNLDGFRPLNDALGHAAGDVVLRRVADRLRHCVREGDFVASLGGDEFCVVQVGAVQPVGASSLAERILAALVPPFELDDRPVAIGGSIGIALCEGKECTADAAPEALLQAADLALDRAKAEGRGGYSFFEAEMNTRLQARRSLEADLRVALERDELEVFYQPLIKAGSGIAGFEALMRWRHPTRGLVSPVVFIPVAEEIGLIGAMGSWILRRACSDAAGWPGAFTVAVNLSPIQFRGRPIAEEVADVLHATGLDPHRLQLEITEGVLLADDECVLATLHAVRNLGVRIAMDDFGTGYSSLGYLRRFPFDKIKIDQSFVRHMLAQNDCMAIVRAVIGLGRSLGMDVNAEGVETNEQLEALVREGCTEFQGFLFSKPQPASEVATMLRTLRRPIVRDRTTAGELANV